MDWVFYPDLPFPYYPFYPKGCPLKLTDAKIRTLPNPVGKSRKIADGHGLMLLVSPTGLKSWYLRKLVGGKEQMISIGRYPEVGLSAARKMAEEISARLAQGLPAKEEPREAIAFERAAREWLKIHADKITPAYCRDIEQRLERHILPIFGTMDITAIRPKQILDALQAISESGIIVKNIKYNSEEQIFYSPLLLKHLD